MLCLFLFNVFYMKQRTCIICLDLLLKKTDYCFVILISGKHLTIYPFMGVLMLSQAPFALTDPAKCDTQHTSVNNYCFSSRVGEVYILGIFVAVLK